MLRSLLIVAALVVGTASAHASKPAHQGIDTINRLAGDISWQQQAPQTDAADAPDVERIQAHLRWVSASLKTVVPASIKTSAVARRAALVAALDRYIEQADFPRHDVVNPSANVRSRSPRFVDSAGRHCAVGELIRVSGHTALVADVQARHEYDFIEDMDVTGLSAWAVAHGFTETELALIQPSYSWGSPGRLPTPHELEQQRLKDEAARRVPRPLKAEQVASVTTQTLNDPNTQGRCLVGRTGVVELDSEVVVGNTGDVRASVTLRERPSRVQLAPIARAKAIVERCFEQAIADATNAVIRSANHTFPAAISDTQTTALKLYSKAEIRESILSQGRVWHRSGSRRTALAQCLAAWPGKPNAVKVPVVVHRHRGDLYIDWRTLGSDFQANRKHWHCVQDTLGYGRLTARGLTDVKLTVTVQSDGTLQ